MDNAFAGYFIEDLRSLLHGLFLLVLVLFGPRVLNGGAHYGTIFLISLAGSFGLPMSFFGRFVSAFYQVFLLKSVNKNKALI